MKCLYCNKELTNHQTKFCNSKCQHDYYNQQNINNWLAGNDPGYTGYNVKSWIRNYLLEKAHFKCELCGWGQENPYTHKIPLEIHHKDGNWQNNRPNNLQVLCPNCHSLTSNYKGLNKNSTRDRSDTIARKKFNICLDCGTIIYTDSVRCRECEAKHRTVPLEQMPVTREQLKQLIRTTPFTQIGKQFGVSDNTIRKWCDKFNLPRKSSVIKQYNNTDWEKV